MNLIKDYQHEVKRYSHEVKFCDKANALLNTYIDAFADLNIKCSLQFTADLSMVFILKSKKSNIYIEQYFDKEKNDFYDDIYIIRVNKNVICYYGSTKLKNLKYEINEIFKRNHL